MSIRALTGAALRAKRARGERAGTEPFGFRAGSDGKTLVPHESEQYALSVIHECRAAGLTYRATAAELNRRNLTTRSGTPWQHQYVFSVLATVARHAPKDLQAG